uniref:Uncharacterized protein n=1 Tax=Sinocyclocheilus anshuiensis TaxID=1608454 RepID=A0A671QAQ6_9TELE
MTLHKSTYTVYIHIQYIYTHYIYIIIHLHIEYFKVSSFSLHSTAGSGDIESLPKSSPGNLSMNNQPGTPRDDGEMSGNFLNPFQSESYSPNMTMSV